MLIDADATITAGKEAFKRKLEDSQLRKNSEYKICAIVVMVPETSSLFCSSGVAHHRFVPAGLLPSSMNVVCLNCRGLDATQVVSDLRGLLQRLAPNLVFFSKTKKSKTEMKNLLPELGNFRGIFVDAKGRSGSLGLLWDKEVKVQFLSCSLHHIDVIVQWVDDKVP